jgi:hypothetical protein
MVPPSASSKKPAFRSWAPVKAPFSWPNSSLSMSVSGMAEQFTATKGTLAAFRHLVNGAGHELLARPRLTREQARALSFRRPAR